MKRRDFLSLFALGTASNAFADSGVMFRAPAASSGSMFREPRVALIDERPEVWAYSMPACPPCVVAKNDFDGAKDLPFRVVWKDSAPTWMPESRPAFWWHTSGLIPTQDDVNNTRQLTGYSGLKDFLARWQNSRKGGKVSATAIPFAQPDPQNHRAVARYHAGHNCPHCGRMQFTISNDHWPSEPQHTHRCGGCSTTWYHNDQRRWLFAG